MSWEIGQTYEATLEVRDKSGQLADPDTAVLTITLPDQSVITPPVTLPAAVTGQLFVDYIFQQAGLHKFSWLTTNPGTARTDYETCRQYLSMISVTEARAHLQITTSGADDELSRFMMAATEVVESKGGYTVPRQFTQQIRDDVAYELVLDNMPVLSVDAVTSAWDGGPSWTAADLRVSPSGIVSQRQPFPFWWGPWDVAYTVGRAIPLERHLQAVKEQLRHLWETQRGSMATPLLGGEEEFTTASGWQFSVPRRVLELLADDIVPSI